MESKENGWRVRETFSTINMTLSVFVSPLGTLQAVVRKQPGNEITHTALEDLSEIMLPPPEMVRIDTCLIAINSNNFGPIVLEPKEGVKISTKGILPLVDFDLIRSDSRNVLQILDRHHVATYEELYRKSTVPSRALDEIMKHISDNDKKIREKYGAIEAISSQIKKLKEDTFLRALKTDSDLSHNTDELEALNTELEEALTSYKELCEEVLKVISNTASGGVHAKRVTRPPPTKRA